MDKEKRTEALTIHLTQGERETLEALAELLERKPAELARILLNREMRREWAKAQEKEHSENRAEFYRPTFGEILGR